MAKKKELNEVKEVVKAPVLRLNENEDSAEEYPTDVRPFVVNFGKSWLKCTEVSTTIEQDPETGSKRAVVTMEFDGQLDGGGELVANEIVMRSDDIVEE